jgi:hypothetical protein
MHVDTGELIDQEMMKDLLARNEGKAPPGWIELVPGEIVEIKGVKCKLVHVNIGKQRITFRPVGNQSIRENRNPVVGVVK